MAHALAGAGTSLAQASCERIDRLLHHGLITEAQANNFREHGAIGSHLENLERNEGFKGFNQTGVSDIMPTAPGA